MRMALATPANLDVPAIGAILDAQGARRGTQALVRGHAGDPLEQERVGVDHRAAQDDQLWVEQVGHVGELGPQGVPRAHHDVAREAVPVARRLDHLLDRDPLDLAGKALADVAVNPLAQPLAASREDGLLGAQRFQAARMAAVAQRPAVHGVHVTELPGEELFPVYSSPCATIPMPTPSPIQTQRKSRTPTPFPRCFSPRAHALASFTR